MKATKNLFEFAKGLMKNMSWKISLLVITVSLLSNLVTFTLFYKYYHKPGIATIEKNVSEKLDIIIKLMNKD